MRFGLLACLTLAVVNSKQITQDQLDRLRQVKNELQAHMDQKDLVTSAKAKVRSILDRQPFEPQYFNMEVAGTIIMFILIALSNMGGLSGAGSNIPIILIFYHMDMTGAVPLSAFVAVSATVLRFILNFNQKHPHKPDANSINYEVCEITMPFVFLGSFYGINLGHMMNDVTQALIFGATVMWSLQTTCKKIQKLRKQEAEKAKAMNETLLTNDTPDLNTVSLNAETADKEEVDEYTDMQKVALKEIFHEEKNHITMKRSMYILMNFVLLLINGHLQKSGTPTTCWISGVVFSLIMISLTAYQVKRVSKIHETKREHLYKYHKNDMEFKTAMDIVKLAILCMIAAILCGCTGIAGGMVLGPLFLTYNMVPKVMSGTNQYITMIAALAVTCQLIALGELHFGYAIVFGITTVLAAGTGIKAINIYTAKSGKQSVILILLAFGLISALVLLPLKFLIIG